MRNLEHYKGDTFEDTCENIDEAITNGDITTHDMICDTAPYCFHPDDVSAVDEWIVSKAEIVHQEESC